MNVAFLQQFKRIILGNDEYTVFKLCETVNGKSILAKEICFTSLIQHLRFVISNAKRLMAGKTCTCIISLNVASLFLMAYEV